MKKIYAILACILILIAISAFGKVTAQVEDIEVGKAKAAEKEIEVSEEGYEVILVSSKKKEYSFSAMVKKYLQKGKDNPTKVCRTCFNNATLEDPKYKQKIDDVKDTIKKYAKQLEANSEFTKFVKNPADALLKGLIMIESAFKKNTRSSAECCGLMQVSAKWQYFCEKGSKYADEDCTHSSNCCSGSKCVCTKCEGWTGWTNPETNIKKGTAILKSYVTKSYGSSCDKVKDKQVKGVMKGVSVGEVLGLIAYNAGRGRIKGCKVEGKKVYINLRVSSVTYAPMVIAWKHVFAGKAPPEVPEEPEKPKPTLDKCATCSSVLHCLACVDKIIIEDVFHFKREEITITEAEAKEPTAVVGKEKFSFVVFSDSHVPKYFNNTVNAINAKNPKLVFGVGDVINTDAAKPKNTTAASQWNKFQNKFSNKISGYYFPSAGNHDIPGYENAWSGKFPPDLKDPNLQGNYPMYYSFDYENSHFVVMEGFKSSISNKQLSFLQNDLRKAKGKYSHIFVFSHLPIMNFITKPEYSGPGNYLQQSQLVSLFKDTGIMFFSGHHHAYYKGNHNEIPCVFLGSAGADTRAVKGGEKQMHSFVEVRVDGSNLQVGAWTVTKYWQYDIAFNEAKYWPTVMHAGLTPFSYSPQMVAG